MILRSNTTNGQQGKKTCVLLGYERGEKGKYKQYMNDLELIVCGSTKCECPFRLREKLVKYGELWIVKLICAFNNHDLTNTLVD